MSLIVYGATDTGRVRDHNEDSILAREMNRTCVGVDALLVVADGMGGHAAGEIASGITISDIDECFRTGVFSNKSADEIESSLSTLLQEVNRSVASAGQDGDNRGMGTTCTLAIIVGERLYYAHVGDSRAYLFRDKKLSQITNDHSWVEEMVRAGIISKELARTHPSRNMVTRAIGLDDTVAFDTGSGALRFGDYVILCSDGLNSRLADEDIQNIAETSAPETMCSDLIKAANQAGGHDNISVTFAYLRPCIMGNSNISSAST